MIESQVAANFIDKESSPLKWEIVCFITNKCDNNCSHCWSKKMFLAKEMPLEWYMNFFKQINYNTISQIKLSGGEATLYPWFPQLLMTIRKYAPPEIPIVIYSNGNKFLKMNQDSDITDYIKAVNQIVGDADGVSFQISADEYHIISYSLKNQISLEEGYLIYEKMIVKFLNAIKAINITRKTHITGKIKLHCNFGRADFHRKVIYPNIKEKSWDTDFIVTEGLVKSGNAQNIKEAEDIEPSDMWSAFVMPGLKMSNVKCQKSQSFVFNDTELYLNPSSDDFIGTVILGWWNLINHVYCGGSVDDFIKYLNE
jgi:hypothetical protein